MASFEKAEKVLMQGMCKVYIHVGKELDVNQFDLDQACSPEDDQ